MSDIQILEKVAECTPGAEQSPGADLHAFLRTATADALTSGMHLQLDEQALERNRNHLAEARNTATRLEIETAALRSSEERRRGLCDEIGRLAKNHPQHDRDLEKAKAVLGKMRAAIAVKEHHLAFARDRVKFFQEAVTAGNTPAIQRAEKVRRLMQQIVG
jgi:hypothetical protein